MFGFENTEMKNKDFTKIITAMISEAKTNVFTKDNAAQISEIDISYEEGIRYFGSMMERILKSIEKIEGNLKKIKDED